MSTRVKNKNDKNRYKFCKTYLIVVGIIMIIVGICLIII